MVVPSKYPPITTLYLTGVGFAFSGTLLLIIAFACPYWLESYPEAYTEFIRLGLWDVCFKNYRHPNYQIDKKINGCHWLYSNEYQNIRDWLQPGWFIFVQFAMCVAMALSISTLFLISVLLMRYCVKFEMFILLSALVLEATAGVCIFLGITVFGGLCFDRSWLQYPNFNHLSWAYALAVISFAIHIGAAGIFFAESTKARQRKRRANSIAYDLATKY